MTFFIFIAGAFTGACTYAIYLELSSTHTHTPPGFASDAIQGSGNG